MKSISQDLSDAEFNELDDLLEAAPAPLEPLNATMVDGYLCGVLVQPRVIGVDELLAPIFDFDGRPLPDDVDTAWLQRVQALVARRHAALNQSMVEQGWFFPLLPDLEAEDEPAAEAPTTDATDAVAPTEPLEGQAKSEGEAPRSIVTETLMPWVLGFYHACTVFPQLHDSTEDSVEMLLARLYRHLPAETEEERQVVATLDQDHPLKNVDEAIEDLVLNVVELLSATESQRYAVPQVRRDSPKLGRNDPCHCGSGKKFKNCHGAS
ncbi:UPF0149 family protein [Roseateles sp. BYS180W]|uniref:UPF0149 family protein n=1 Tax=Roseateles rivi TaxID=3299028 RepID=A0ABW7FUA3_9BURK